MTVDTSGWSGDGDFTRRLLDEIAALPGVEALKVEDAPASRADSGFSFISNELFVQFSAAPRRVRIRRFGLIPISRVIEEKLMTLGGLERALATVADIGMSDYSDDGMLQYLRTQRILQPYQSRGYKLIELVRVYEAGTITRRSA